MIGWIMMAIPFIAIFIYVAKEDGIKVAIGCFLFVAAMVAWIYAAAYLIAN